MTLDHHRPSATAEVVRKGTTWAYQGTFRALERTFRVRAGHPEAGSRIAPLLEPFLDPVERGSPGDTYSVVWREGSTPRFAVYDGEDRVLNSNSLDEACQHVVWYAFERAVERVDRYLVIHAAAASWRGRGVVLPGAIGSGKTTLVAGLVRAGFTFHTDEFSLIDLDTGLLHPFPRPLWMTPGSIELVERIGMPGPSISRGAGPKHFVRPNDIRPGGLAEPCPVRLVILPTRRSDEPAAVRPVTRPDVLLELAQGTFNLERLGTPGLRALARMLENAEPYRLSMGDLGDAVDLVRGLVEGAAS